MCKCERIVNNYKKLLTTCKKADFDEKAVYNYIILEI